MELERNNEVRHIEGYIENIIFRNEDNGYTVFTTSQEKGEITCVGELSYISAGEFIVADGEFVRHPTYLTQFKISSYTFRAPADIESVEKYLGSGAIKGVGPKLAKRIVDTLGDDTFRLIEEEPERLAEVKGISLERAIQISEQVTSRRDLRDALVFMQGYGITMRLANKVYEKYGAKVYQIIRENPYELAETIDGIGFKKADEIAMKLGVPMDSDFRIKSCIVYCIGEAGAQGHVYLPYEELSEEVARTILVDMSDIDKYIMDLTIEGKIVVKNLDQNKCVYSTNMYRAEQMIARRLIDLDIEQKESAQEIYNKIDRVEKELDIELDDIQKEAVSAAACHGFTVITGGPGTGKTTTINAIIKYFSNEKLEIMLAAPTGRAAKRMTETCGWEALTIHRLLEVSAGSMEGDNRAGIAFARNEENPLETDVLIIDEMSMVDVYLMNSLLKAVPVGTRLILVGDVDQLASVGPGNVLKDIIKSETFTIVKLEKIFRQAEESDIITNAHKINHGEKVDLTKKSKDFLFIRCNSPEEIMNSICRLVKDKLPDYVNASPNEIQVLSPSRKTPTGVDQLNSYMQEYFNPRTPKKNEKKIGDIVFREGDKVMQIKNNYQLTWEKKNKYGFSVEEGTGVFNGDTGVIKKIDTFGQIVTVEYDDREVDYDYGMLDELELAYAVTVHKSQGSEYPAVVIPMYRCPAPLINRNILYTAVTRARFCVCLVGLTDVFEQMEGNKSDAKRYTSLDLRIREIAGI